MFDISPEFMLCFLSGGMRYGYMRDLRIIICLNYFCSNDAKGENIASPEEE